MLRAYGLTEKGRVGPTNEDCFAIHEQLGLCVIADGLGGHNAGEVAARLAVDAIVEFVARRCAPRAAQAGGVSVSRLRSPEPQARFGEAPRTAEGAAVAPERLGPWPFGYDSSLSPGGNLLRTAIHLANLQILESAIATDGYAGMGTTIVAARVVNGRLSVAHVGDSRLYLIAKRQLRQVTTDDSWLTSMLADDPDADPVLLQQHPMCGALTNVVGAIARTDVHVAEETLAGGERLLLTTDGVHGVLDEKRLMPLLDDEDPREIARNVIATALARGSRDDCTAIAARYSA